MVKAIGFDQFLYSLVHQTRSRDKAAHTSSTYAYTTTTNKPARPSRNHAVTNAKTVQYCSTADER